MTDKNKRLLAYGIVVLAIIVAGVLGVSYPLPPPPELPEVEIQAIKDTEFRSVYIAHDLDVDGDADIDGTLNADAMDIDDAVDIAGVLTADSLDVDNGSITLQNDETIGNVTDNYITIGGGVVFASTTITATEGLTITPTIYTGYRLNAAGAVTITLAACSQDFQLLVLYGEDAQTITINDTNVRTNDGGVQALGQYDVITWMCIKTEWVELSESNNS